MILQDSVLKWCDFLRAKLLSRGGSVDAGVLFSEFYGAAPDVAPLVAKRGLTLVKAKSKARTKTMRLKRDFIATPPVCE